MNKKQKILRLIIASILLLASAFLIYLTASCVYDMLHVELGALTILVLIAFSIYTSPILLFAIIFQIVVLVKKKFYIWDFLASILFVLSWASLYIVPIIVNSIIL